MMILDDPCNDDYTLMARGPPPLVSELLSLENRTSSCSLSSLFPVSSSSPQTLTYSVSHQSNHPMMRCLDL